MYDFDIVIDRRGTSALKVDALQKRYGNPNLLPLWVADMDFATPPFIVDALKKRLEHPIFGYTQTPTGFFPSIIHWLKNIHNWEVLPEWLIYVPGVVKGIGLVLNVFTQKGDKILLQPPVYHILKITIEANERQVVNNPLKLVNGQYEIDFEQFEQALKECKIFILCNPHNPGGTVWSPEILTKIGELCFQHNVLVISDEIHADLCLFGNRHTPFASVSEKAAQNSITLGAPSKIFNIPGIVSSFAVVPNEAIRKKFFSWLVASELDEANLFALIATEAAYTHGAEWRLQLLKYLEENVNFVENYLAEHIPAIKIIKPQASFLVWLDCRLLGLSHPDLINLFQQKAGLALNEGKMFGENGDGFMRLNVGTPRSVLAQALNQLHAAVNP